MTNKKTTNKITYLDFRISPILKQALDEYCEEHIEKNTEAINNAIKHLAGFGGLSAKKPVLKFEPDKGKTIRLNVRTHPLLKEALDEYCRKNSENYTEAITNAIKRYIGFEKNE